MARRLYGAITSFDMGGLGSSGPQSPLSLALSSHAEVQGPSGGCWWLDQYAYHALHGAPHSLVIWSPGNLVTAVQTPHLHKYCSWKNRNLLSSQRLGTGKGAPAHPLGAEGDLLHPLPGEGGPAHHPRHETGAPGPISAAEEQAQELPAEG